MSKLDFLDPFIIQSGFEEKEFGPGGQVINLMPYDEQLEDLTGLSKINYVSYDFGLSMTNSATNAIIFIGGNNGGLNFSTYSVGHSSHQFFLSLVHHTVVITLQAKLFYSVQVQ